MDLSEFYRREKEWIAAKEQELGMPADEYREGHRGEEVVRFDGMLLTYTVYRDGTIVLVTLDYTAYASPEALVLDLASGDVGR